MLEELSIVSSLLTLAVDRYLKVCYAIEGCSIPIAHLNRLADEITSITSCTTKLGYARASLGRSRNQSHPITSIHSLPCETISLIFDFLHAADTCSGEEIACSPYWSETEHYDRFNPEVISHVCARWRHIMINTRRYWSHVDLIPRHGLGHNLFARADVYATRAGSLPLDVHIIDTDVPHPYHLDNDPTFIQFLPIVARNMQSLDLISRRPFQGFHSSILQAIFANAVPGTMTQLRLSDETPSRHSSHVFFEAVENPKDGASLMLDLPKQQLEELLRPITVLNLSGLYPHWSSQAYHGLSELYIVPWKTAPPTITATQLAGILASSPKLQVLHLNVKVVGLLPDQTSARVRLEDLETLNIQSLLDHGLKTLLRLIEPGLKPLQLALTLPPKLLDPSLNRAIQRFFTRANVSTLLLSGSDANVWLTELLDASRNLKYLSVYCSIPTEIRIPASLPEAQDASIVRPSLEELCFRETALQFEGLEHLVERYAVRTLSLWNCPTSHDGTTPLDPSYLTNKLSRRCSAVNVLGECDEDPTTGW